MNGAESVYKRLEIAAGAGDRLRVTVQPIDAQYAARCRLLKRHNGAALEYIVGMPEVADGLPYQLMLQNDNAENADAEIVIDGQNMGRFRVWARSHIVVKRPSDMVGFADRAFTFFAAGGDKAARAGVATGTPEADAKNGAVTVTWYVDRPQVTAVPLSLSMSSRVGIGKTVIERDGLWGLERQERHVICQRNDELEEEEECSDRDSAGSHRYFKSTNVPSAVVYRGGVRQTGKHYDAAAQGGVRALKHYDATAQDSGAAFASAKAGATMLGKATGQTFTSVPPLTNPLPPIVVPFRLVVADIPEEPEFVALNTAAPHIVMPLPMSFVRVP